MGPPRPHALGSLFVRTKSDQKAARTKVLDSFLGAALTGGRLGGGSSSCCAGEELRCPVNGPRLLALPTGLAALPTAARPDKTAFAGERWLAVTASR